MFFEFGQVVRVDRGDVARITVMLDQEFANIREVLFQTEPGLDLGRMPGSIVAHVSGIQDRDPSPVVVDHVGMQLRHIGRRIDLS